MPEHHELMGGSRMSIVGRTAQWQPFDYQRAQLACLECTKTAPLRGRKILPRTGILTKGKIRGRPQNGQDVRYIKRAVPCRVLRAITGGERSPDYVKSFYPKLRAHLLPFFGDKVLSEITPGLVQEYRIMRDGLQEGRKRQPIRPARSTIHHEIVTLRQVLKTANRQGWLPFLPDLSAPYKASAGFPSGVVFRL